MQSTCSFFVNLGFIMVKKNDVPSIINQNPIFVCSKTITPAAAEDVEMTHIQMQI